MLPHSLLVHLAWTSLAACYGASASTVKFDFQKYAPSPSRLAKRDHIEAALPEASGIAYLMSISIGTPPQPFLIQFDTGSSNLWVQTADTDYCQDPANQCNVTGTFDSQASSSFTDISPGFQIQYGLGSAAGDYVSDNVHVGGVILQNLTFGLATQVPDGSPTFGIVGAGLKSLEAAAEQQGIEFPTLVDALYTSGAIDRRAFSVYLDDQEAGQGSVIFGGVDSSKYTGDLTTFAMAPNDTGVYDRYRVDMTAISFVDDSGKTTTLSAAGMAAPAILDTGASLLILPKPVADSLATGFGAVMYEGQFYLVNCALRNSNATLNIQFGGQSGAEYKIPVNQLIGDSEGAGTFPNGDPVCQMNIEGLEAGDVNVAALGGYTLGDPFLRNVYAVFDQDSLEISLAQAKYNVSGSGSIANIPSGSGGISQAVSTVSATPTAISIPASLTAATGSVAATSADDSSATATALTQNPGTPTFSLATAAASGSGGSGSGNAAPTVGVSMSWTFGLGLATLCLAIFL